jgi:hypothetical protein
MNMITKGLVGLRDWVDDRFPLMQLWNDHMGQYYAPKNFNFWYYFGVLSLVVLVIQLVTGIWLVMNYKPDAGLAFGSVEYIMRDVSWGWLIRYMHSTGASFFFIVVYLHMFRGLLYGSYKKPRELIWILGMFIYLSLMAEAFFGYLLPWGQMSYWGAQVIISLFGAIPWVGDTLALWIRGDYVVSDITLNRFFSFQAACARRPATDSRRALPRTLRPLRGNARAEAGTGHDRKARRNGAARALVYARCLPVMPLDLPAGSAGSRAGSRPQRILGSPRRAARTMRSHSQRRRPARGHGRAPGGPGPLRRRE